MKWLVKVNKGTEDFVQKEIKELINIDSKIEDSFLTFEAEYDSIFLLSYKSQSIINLSLLFDSFNFKEMDQIINHFNKLNLSDYIINSEKCNIVCDREGNHVFNRKDVEHELLSSKKYNFSYDLCTKRILVNIVGEKCYISLDFSGEIGKRDYRLFHNYNSLKPTIVFSLIKSFFETKQKNQKLIVVDPLANYGSFLIEFALYLSNKSIHYFNKSKFPFLNFDNFKDYDFDTFFNDLDSKSLDKFDVSLLGYDSHLSCIKGARKEAKIAGVDKLIHFSKVTLDWLDTKFDKNSTDFIFTYFHIKKGSKNIGEFFSQADYILKEDGKIVLITNKLEALFEEIQNSKFKIIFDKEVWQGKEKLSLLHLIRA